MKTSKIKNTNAPVLNFIPVWIVEGWQTEEIKGMGCYFPSHREGICTYENKYMVFIDGSDVPSMIYHTKIYTDAHTAAIALDKEKQAYIKYCREQVEKYTEKIRELTK